MSRRDRAIAHRPVSTPATTERNYYGEYPADLPQTIEAQVAWREERRRAELQREYWPDGRPPVGCYRGGPTADEMRAVWRRTHRHGASGREVAPGTFALLWAWRELGMDVAADERFNRAGFFTELRESVLDDMVPDSVEAAQMVAQGRLFDKKLLGKMARARLPEMVAGASTPAQIGQAVRDLNRVPDWVWDAGDQPVGDVRGELEEV